MSAAKNKAAAAIGRLGGKAKSERKAEAVRKNASAPPKPGNKPRGRPKKDNIQNRPIEHYPSLSQEPSIPVYDSYPLWQLLHEEHGLILLNGEIEDIINVATPIIDQRKKSLPEDAAANSDVRLIALERDRMRHALQKIEAESHDARAVDYAEEALR